MSLERALQIPVAQLCVGSTQILGESPREALQHVHDLFFEINVLVRPRFVIELPRSPDTIATVSNSAWRTSVLSLCSRSRFPKVIIWSTT